MKLVAVSRVRDEADIIEAFVRHHAVHFSKIIVLDDGSCDGTYEALQSLRAEGLPLVVLRSPVVGYEQSLYMTRLLQIAVNQFGADWVAPLDADEFIEPDVGVTLADILREQKSELLSVAWNNFEWRAVDDESSERNPVVRQRFRRPPRSDLNKLLVPAYLVDETTQLSQGNHQLIFNGELSISRPLQSVNLGHFPIRSVHQYASKVVIGYLQYVAMPNWNRLIGFHYIEPFQALLSGGLSALKERMLIDSLDYSSVNEARQFPPAASRDDPLRYQGGPLKLTLPDTAFLQNILHCAEAIARDRANVMRAAKSVSPSLSTERSVDEVVFPEQKLADGEDAAPGELERLNFEKDALEMRLSKAELELLDARQRLFFQAEQLNSRAFKVVRGINDYLARAGISPGALIDRLLSLNRK